MKDAAFVKMRDSVSFYKIDPDEYVLRKQGCGARAYMSFTWSVHRIVLVIFLFMQPLNRRLFSCKVAQTTATESYIQTARILAQLTIPIVDEMQCISEDRQDWRWQVT